MSCGPRAAQMDAFLPEDYPAMREEQTRHTFCCTIRYLEIPLTHAGSHFLIAEHFQVFQCFRQDHIPPEAMI